MRRASAIALTVVVAGLVLFAANRHGPAFPPDLADYYVERFTEDTGALNAVAAIYLDYRVYDTLFEALILLSAVTAMLHFFDVGRRS